MDCSMPGFPVHHQLLELTRTHVHQVSDAIQPSHPLSSPSPHTFNLSQHHGLFKWVSSSHKVAKVLEFQLHHQSFQWNTQGWSPLGWTGWISLQYKRLSRVFFNTTIQKHQFFSAQFFFIVQISHPYMTTGKNIDLTRQTFVGKVMSLLFNMLSRVGQSFSSKEQVSFNFKAAVTICSDFGAPQNKISHCFHCFPILSYEVMGLDAMIFVSECWIFS